MMEISYYIIIGCFSGFISGLLGIGGGTVIVPVLSMVFVNQDLPFEMIMHLAIGSSLMIMALTSQSVVWAYDKAGFIEWPLYRRLLPGILMGTVVGALIAQFLSTKILSVMLGVMLFVIAIRMLIRINVESDKQLPGSFVNNFICLLTGLISGLLGLGGGTITIPYLTHHNVEMRNAIGVSSACSLSVAIVGAISCMLTGLNAEGLPAYSTGYVYWPAVVCVALPSLIFTRFGVQVAQHLSVNVLKRIFALFLLTVAFKMI